MGGNYRPDWTLTWTNVGYEGGNWFGDVGWGGDANIINANIVISNVITQDMQTATEVAVAAVMPGTAGSGIRVALLRERPDGSYQSLANGDPTWGFTLPVVTSTYFDQTFTVYGDEVPRFKIALQNLTTVNVDGTKLWATYRQAQGNYV